MQSKGEPVIRKIGLGRMSTGEYQANLNGLNMFFGAVLGIVLAGSEKLSTWQFGLMLVMLAGAVISILYISSSKHRLGYSVYALLAAVAIPRIMDLALRTKGLVPDKVQPTLIVWTLMTILVEFWARVTKSMSENEPDSSYDQLSSIFPSRLANRLSEEFSFSPIRKPTSFMRRSIVKFASGFGRDCRAVQRSAAFVWINVCIAGVSVTERPVAGVAAS